MIAPKIEEIRQRQAERRARHQEQITRRLRDPNLLTLESGLSKAIKESRAITELREDWVVV